MGAKRKSTDMSADVQEVKIVQAEELTEEPQVTDEVSQGEITDGGTEEPKTPAKPKKVRNRSAKYVAVRSQIDRTKKYDPFAAVELVKKLSYSSFDGTLTAHVVVKETGMTAALTLPHATGKDVKVAIVDDALLKEIEAGKIDFDVLISTPQFMPKLAKLAPVLGPKGLMPNPKNGTLTPNPEAAKKKLEAGTVTLKTEKKAPLMHIRMGKVGMETKQLVENLEAILKSLTGKLDRLTIAASMSPGVKVEVSK